MSQLTKCPHCEKDTPLNGAHCLHCGESLNSYPSDKQSGQSQKLSPLAITLIIIVALGGFLLLTSGLESSLPRSTSGDGSPRFATFEPQSITGTGDSVVNVEIQRVALIRIRGNDGSDHFAVWALDQNNEQVDLLVNTTDPYKGARLLNVGHTAHRLEIEARGSWDVDIVPLSEAPSMTIPGEYEGVGDTILLLDGDSPDTMFIKNNGSNSNFIVISRSETDGDLLINEIAPYEGTVVVSRDTVVLDIKAEGAWVIAAD